jgi:hypothetical protein
MSAQVRAHAGSDRDELTCAGPVGAPADRMISPTNTMPLSGAQRSQPALFI